MRRGYIMESKLLIRRLRPKVLCLGFILLFSLPVLPAQSAPPASYLIFPRFVALDGVSTGIAVFNPTTRDATVNLSVTGIDGTALGNTTIKVAALGQIAKTAGELFPSLFPVDGWLAISSTTPGLVAYYETFDSSVDYIDGTDAPESAMELIFPVVPGSSDGAIELDFLNTNSRATNVELKLWSLGGDLLGKATIQVPAGGIYSNLASNLFPPGTNFFGASHITAASKLVNIFSAAQSVYGTSLFAGFSSVASIGGYQDIAALNAVPLTRVSNAGVIPYFRTGSQHASILSLASIEPAKVDVTITAVHNDGSTLGTRSVTLNPDGGFRGDLQSVFPALDSAEGEGWLLLQATGRVYGTLIYGRSDAGALSAIPMQTTPKMAFVFPQVVQNSGSYTEITLVNPSPNTSYADVYVAQSDGTTVSSNRVTLLPSSRVSQPLDQLMFPDMITQSGGYVFVRAADPLFATASIWSSSGSTLLNFAPESAPSSFSPAPPPPKPSETKFVVSGRVTLNDSPLPGSRIVLSGPMGANATSAGDGSFIFRDLPAGKYSMAIDQIGFLFIPAQVSFEITTANKRQDLNVVTPPDGIVYPATAPVKSPDTTVTIFDKGFNGTSQAYVDLIRLATAFVDSNRLQVVVPAYMLAVPSKFEIFVVTNGSGPDRWVTNSFQFIAYQNKPVLKSVTPAAQIVEGGPAQALTLLGTGFLRDAKVKINGVGDGIEATVVDDTQIIAAVPASYFAIAGIYPVTVQNPYPPDIESNLQLLTVYYPTPEVDDLIPNVVPARLEEGANPLNIEVLGYGFRRGALVLINGQPIPTSYCESDAYCRSVHLYAIVPVSYLRQSGFAEVTVQNPTPSLGVSGKTLLRIEGLQPTITSVLPGSATLTNTPFQFTMPVIVNGTNFGPQTAIRIYLAGTTPPGFTSASVSVLSTTQISAAVLMDYQTSLGEWKVEVANPPPGGGQSDAVSFFITPGNFVGNPFLISLNPQAVAAGGPAFTLTINGTNFKSGSQIYFYVTPLITTVVSDKQVRAEVPASLIQSAGKIPIAVTNPDNGGTSNRLYLDIR